MQTFWIMIKIYKLEAPWPFLFTNNEKGNLVTSLNLVVI